MATPNDLEFLMRVLLATGCGALIGLERQYRSRTAGLRTQALVAAPPTSRPASGSSAAVSFSGKDCPCRVSTPLQPCGVRPRSDARPPPGT